MEETTPTFIQEYFGEYGIMVLGALLYRKGM